MCRFRSSLTISVWQLSVYRFIGRLMKTRQIYIRGIPFDSVYRFYFHGAFSSIHTLSHRVLAGVLTPNEGNVLQYLLHGISKLIFLCLIHRTIQFKHLVPSLATHALSKLIEHLPSKKKIAWTTLRHRKKIYFSLLILCKNFILTIKFKPYFRHLAAIM